LHILQNKSVGNGRYLIQKYCQIPTARFTDGVAPESSELVAECRRKVPMMGVVSCLRGRGLDGERVP
jgi:hypothetical protein